jgi:hypothetical protein
LRARYVAWSVPVVLGASILSWVLAFRGDRTATPAPPAAAEQAALARQSDPALARVLELAKNPALSRARLVDFYAGGAGDPGAVPARKLALGALFSQENLATKLSSVLEAVERDPTPARQDPLWSDIVGRLAEVWQGDTLTRGIDLMEAESRPRAKRAVIASFAELARSDRLAELTPEQRTALGDRFIDLYHSLPEDQKPEVEAALRKSVSDDVADIVRGKGLKNDNELELQRAYNRATANAPKVVAEAPAPAGTPLEPSPDFRGE